MDNAVHVKYLYSVILLLVVLLAKTCQMKLSTEYRGYYISGRGVQGQYSKPGCLYLGPESRLHSSRLTEQVLWGLVGSTSLD